LKKSPGRNESSIGFEKLKNKTADGGKDQPWRPNQGTTKERRKPCPLDNAQKEK